MPGGEVSNSLMKRPVKRIPSSFTSSLVRDGDYVIAGLGQKLSAVKLCDDSVQRFKTCPPTLLADSDYKKPRTSFLKRRVRHSDEPTLLLQQGEELKFKRLPFDELKIKKQSIKQNNKPKSNTDKKSHTESRNKNNSKLFKYPNIKLIDKPKPESRQNLNPPTQRVVSFKREKTSKPTISPACELKQAQAPGAAAPTTQPQPPTAEPLPDNQDDRCCKCCCSISWPITQPLFTNQINLATIPFAWIAN